MAGSLNIRIEEVSDFDAFKVWWQIVSIYACATYSFCAGKTSRRAGLTDSIRDIIVVWTICKAAAVEVDITL